MDGEKHEGILDVVTDMISGVVPAHVRDEELLILYARRLIAAYHNMMDDFKKGLSDFSNNLVKCLDNEGRGKLPQKCERCSEGVEVDCGYRGEPCGCNSGDPGYHPMLGKAGLRELELRQALRRTTDTLRVCIKYLPEGEWDFMGDLVKWNLDLLDGEEENGEKRESQD